jgi:hypothetical protein
VFITFTSILVTKLVTYQVTMARTGKTAQEFIQSSFSPIVAILSSPKVNNVVAKNNLSFTELLRPFASLDTDCK